MVIKWIFYCAINNYPCQIELSLSTNRKIKHFLVHETPTTKQILLHCLATFNFEYRDVTTTASHHRNDRVQLVTVSITRAGHEWGTSGVRVILSSYTAIVLTLSYSLGNLVGSCLFH